MERGLLKHFFRIEFEEIDFIYALRRKLLI